MSPRILLGIVLTTVVLTSNAFGKEDEAHQAFRKDITDYVVKALKPLCPFSLMVRFCVEDVDNKPLALWNPDEPDVLLIDVLMEGLSAETESTLEFAMRKMLPQFLAARRVKYRVQFFVSNSRDEFGEFARDKWRVDKKALDPFMPQ